MKISGEDQEYREIVEKWKELGQSDSIAHIRKLSEFLEEKTSDKECRWLNVGHNARTFYNTWFNAIEGDGEYIEETSPMADFFIAIVQAGYSVALQDVADWMESNWDGDFIEYLEERYKKESEKEVDVES